MVNVSSYVFDYTNDGILPTLQHDKPAPSMDTLRNAKSFAASMKIISELELLSHRLNTILEQIDPPAFKAHQKLRDHQMREPYYQALASIDPLLWEGRSVIFNRTTPEHQDRRDERMAWTPLVILGKCKGGDLRLADLGINIHYEPGTIIFIRGASLKHEVLQWEGSQRIAVAHFTHANIWHQAGIAYPVDHMIVTPN